MTYSYNVHGVTVITAHLISETQIMQKLIVIVVFDTTQDVLQSEALCLNVN